jgi:hypothetical protein
MLLIRLARLAIRDTVGPTLFFNVLQAGIIVRELAKEVLEAVPQVLRYRLLDDDVFSPGHDSLCQRYSLLSRDNYRAVNRGWWLVAGKGLALIPLIQLAEIAADAALAVGEPFQIRDGQQDRQRAAEKVRAHRQAVHYEIQRQPTCHDGELHG